MLRQKLVYCPVAPSESHVWALQEDFQILVEFGSGCWKMESTSPWEDQSTVPRDAWKSSVFKFVSFHSNKTSNYFWDTQISGLQSFPPQYNPSPSISSKKFLKFSIIRTLNRWNHFLKITKNFKMISKNFFSTSGRAGNLCHLRSCHNQMSLLGSCFTVPQRSTHIQDVTNSLH